MKYYILNNCKYVFKRKLFYIFLIVYFLVLLITLLSIGISSNVEYMNNHSQILDEDGIIKKGNYDLKNLLFQNYNSALLNILNIFVFIYLGLLIHIFFKETEKNLDLIIVTKSISRFQIFWVKIISIIVLYLPLFFIIIIPAIIGVAIDASSNVTSFFYIWLSDIFKKLAIFLFLPLFLVILLLIKSRIGFIIFVALFLPVAFVINLGLQESKMKDINQTGNYYFVNQAGEIEKYYTYQVENDDEINYLNYQNFQKWKQDNYQYLWTLDVFAQINYFSLLFNPEIIANKQNLTFRNDNQRYSISPINQKNYAKNTNDKFIGVYAENSDSSLENQKIDQAFSSYLQTQILDLYDQQFAINVGPDWTDDDQAKFEILIANKDEKEKPRPLGVTEMFVFANDEQNKKYLQFHEQKKYLPEVNLTINYLKDTNSLAPFYATYNDLYINEIESYFSKITYKNYVDWYILLIYPVLTIVFLIWGFVLFARKDFV